MLELIFSALITLVPDYIYRTRYQGKQITLFTFWYELRWGITACVALTLTLITVIFYYHPIASNVISGFRTVSIISDRPGRVEEVYVSNDQEVKAGDPIFRLDTSRQRAAAETARRRIAEIDAGMLLAKSELEAAEGNIRNAEGGLLKANDELERREELAQRNSAVVTPQELEALRATRKSRQGLLDAARAQRDVVQLRITSLLPAERKRAEAEIAQAETEIKKATVLAGTDGTVKQFLLKPGDIVNPILRPAGILVPATSGRGRFVASFQQINAQVLHVGMIAEITCASQPLTVIPMKVITVQDVITTGQFRPSDQLIELQDRVRPGTVLTILETVFEGQADAIPRGSSCVGVAYTSHAARIKSGEITGIGAFIMRLVDSMGIANAIVIRAQALILPIRAIVFPASV
jgi:multidrug resistance efflux pump